MCLMNVLMNILITSLLSFFFFFCFCFMFLRIFSSFWLALINRISIFRLCCSMANDFCVFGKQSVPRGLELLCFLKGLLLRRKPRTGIKLFPLNWRLSRVLKGKYKTGYRNIISGIWYPKFFKFFIPLTRKHFQVMDGTVDIEKISLFKIPINFQKGFSTTFLKIHQALGLFLTYRLLFYIRKKGSQMAVKL